MNFHFYQPFLNIDYSFFSIVGVFLTFFFFYMFRICSDSNDEDHYHHHLPCIHTDPAVVQLLSFYYDLPTVLPWDASVEAQGIRVQGSHHTVMTMKPTSATRHVAQNEKKNKRTTAPINLDSN